LKLVPNRQAVEDEAALALVMAGDMARAESATVAVFLTINFRVFGLTGQSLLGLRAWEVCGFR
jgi:hypothetical protein